MSKHYYVWAEELDDAKLISEIILKSGQYIIVGDPTWVPQAYLYRVTYEENQND